MTRTRDLTNQVNAAATRFALPEDFLPGTLEVHLNGVRQRRDAFFAESGTRAFTTTRPPKLGDTLSVQYEVVAPADVVSFPMVVASGVDPRR